MSRMGVLIALGRLCCFLCCHPVILRLSSISPAKASSLAIAISSYICVYSES